MQITREQRFTTILRERATCNLYKLPDFISGVLHCKTRPTCTSVTLVQGFTCGALDVGNWHGSVQLLCHVWLFATHGLQHARLTCPSPTPRACSNSCPLSWWCHPIISSSVIPFSPKNSLEFSAEAETPILCHLIQRTDSLEKMVMLGKIEGRRRRGWKRKLA